jgi:hypothetical protein
LIFFTWISLLPWIWRRCCFERSESLRNTRPYNTENRILSVSSPAPWRLSCNLPTTNWLQRIQNCRMSQENHASGSKIPRLRVTGILSRNHCICVSTTHLPR